MMDGLAQGERKQICPSSTFLFYLGSWQLGGWCTLLLGRVICFTHSTDSNANLIQKRGVAGFESGHSGSEVKAIKSYILISGWQRFLNKPESSYLQRITECHSWCIYTYTHGMELPKVKQFSVLNFSAFACVCVLTSLTLSRSVAIWSRLFPRWLWQYLPPGKPFASPSRKRIWKKNIYIYKIHIYTYVCITESLCCTSETNTL